MGKPVELVVALEAGTLTVGVANRSPKEITIVVHPRYLSIELKDASGQFVAGRASPDQATALPSKADYATVAPGATAEAFRLPVTRTAEGWAVGALSFPELPAETELRALYKAEPVMPNLPEKKRATFFRGPAESGRHAVVLR